MKQMFVIAITTAALAACGGKAKKSSLPENTGGATQTQTEGSQSSGANGGATYGGAMTPNGGAMGSGTADPCAGQ